MDYDKHIGLNRKYGAVKKNNMKNKPVTLEFIQEKKDKIK